MLSTNYSHAGTAWPNNPTSHVLFRGKLAYVLCEDAGGGIIIFFT